MYMVSHMSAGQRVCVFVASKVAKSVVFCKNQSQRVWRLTIKPYSQSFVYMHMQLCIRSKRNSNISITCTIMML